MADGRVTRIDVWLDPASVDAGLPEIDAALKGGDFFAVDRYPRTTYSSTSISEKDGKQVARGNLTMKGHSRPLDAPFRLQREGGDVVISGALTLNRLDYGIGTGDWSNTKWLGAEVKVAFRAALAQAVAAASAQTSAASARSSAAPSPRQALPCMQASVAGRSAASRSSVAAVWGACAK